MKPKQQTEEMAKLLGKLTDKIHDGIEKCRKEDIALLNPPNPHRVLMLIEWEDSHHRSGWVTDQPSLHPLICQSVGWLISETGTATTLALSVTLEDEPQRCGEITIPKRCVRRVKQLAGFD